MNDIEETDVDVLVDRSPDHQDLLALQTENHTSNLSN
jgi:hypothetical protein